MVTKHTSKWSAFTAAALALLVAERAMATSTSRELRNLLNCQQAVARAGLSYAHLLNGRVSNCLVAMHACDVVGNASSHKCRSAEEQCDGVAGAARSAGSELGWRISKACKSVSISSLMDVGGFAALADGCTVDSMESLVRCLAEKVRKARLATLMRLHPNACALVERASLSELVPLDACDPSDPTEPGEPPVCEGPLYCGGPDAVACPDGFVCDRTDALCGQPDVGGACVAAGEECVDEGAQVCGCDGVTYASDCARLAAGVTKQHAGECNPGPRPCGVGQPACPSGQYCDYPMGDCGESGVGTCRPMDSDTCDLCTDFIGGTQCGCDFVTYESDCARAAAGVSQWFMGACF
jgi:hypothetical protein